MLVAAEGDKREAAGRGVAVVATKTRESGVRVREIAGESSEIERREATAGQRFWWRWQSSPVAVERWSNGYKIFFLAFQKCYKI